MIDIAFSVLTRSVPVLKRSLSVMALCVLFLAACERTQPDQRPAVALGSEPIPRVVRCSESTDVLIDLAEMNRRGISILHMSGMGNLSLIPRQRMAELRELVKNKMWDAIRMRPDGDGEEILGSGEYLHAAAQLGLIREVVWVLPSKLLEYSDAERRVRMFLASEGSGFSSEEIAGMRYEGGCVSGMLTSVPVHICGVETLPPISGPVTLDIDAGFFPEYAKARRMTVLESIKDFFEKWSPRKIPVHEAFVRTTLREQGMTPLYLYVVGIVRAVLEEPSLMNAAPSETWFLVNMAAGLVDNSPTRDAAEFIRQARMRYPDDRDLRMLGGIVESLGGNASRGLDTLSRLCAKEHDYCYALVYSGKKLGVEGRKAEAEKFFRAAGNAAPEGKGGPPRASSR